MIDEMFERLNRIYPNSKFALIPKYEPEKWVDKEYDSHLDNKAAINRWATKALDYDQARVRIEEGYRIGWIVPKGYVVIDVDNGDDERAQEYVERILDKFEVKYSYNYTSRGIHILLRDEKECIKNNSKMKCALNIAIDTRANDGGYIILPTNDPNRSWGNWSDFVEEVPYFLKPVVNCTFPSFIGMIDGDGRNDALWRWRARLMSSNKLSDEEIEKSIKIINENLFDTAIPNPELYKTVLRELKKKDALPPEAKENPYNKIAEDIMERHDIICYAGNFFIFKGTHYQEVHEIDIEKLIHNDVSKNLPAAARREIMEFLKLKTDVKYNEINRDWYKIACGNGIINLVTGELSQPTKSDLNTIYIPWNYEKDPQYSPRIDEFMKQITGGDVIKMKFLYQIAGYCLLKKNLFEKFFLFRGEGGTGKSTYTNLLTKLVGKENCSHVSLPDFDKDYYLSTTVNKLLNIDDDVVDGKRLEYTGRFKSFVSGEIISTRQIYRDVIDFDPFATLVFSCNRLPQIMDKTSGLYRRIILVELNNKVLRPDPLFMQKVVDKDMEYFLFKAVEGIKEALEVGHMVITQSEEALIEQFRRRQSPLFEFLYEHDIRLKDLVGKPCMILYKQFSEWCDEAGYTKKLTMFTFREEICTTYDCYPDLAGDQVNKNKMVFKKRGQYDPEWKPF